MKKWILVDFASCPRCGDDAEICTSSEVKNQFDDDDEARCCQSETCDSKGVVFVDDNTAEIRWNEDNFIMERIKGDYNDCGNFTGDGNGHELSTGQEIYYNGTTCTIVDFGSGAFVGIIKVKTNGYVIFIDESFNA